MADEASGNFSTRPYRHEGRKCPLIFYEKPSLCIFLFWLMAGLDAPLSDFWLYAAEPPSREKEPRRYVPSNIYREGKAKLDREGKAKVGQQVSLKELLSVNTPRLAEYYRKCWRQVAATIKRPVAPTARDKAIASHWPLVAKKCRIVPKADRADAIQACMERLIEMWNRWGPDAFGKFADQAIDWAIQDFLKQLRRQVPVQRSINLNDPAGNPADDNNDDDDDKPPAPERPDMMRFNAMETQATAAKRRLVADSLGCLNLHQRRVIEGRLALNGYQYPVSHEALADELGMSERHIRRIESAAIEKLQQAVL
jgi:RNA polymerase sigma factor (sigma-70 family)